MVIALPDGCASLGDGAADVSVTTVA